VRVDRGSYWQCAFVVPKGAAAPLLSQGIGAMTAAIEATEPRLTMVDHDLQSLDQLHLLDVSLDRLTRWHRSGLLAIGDAAHAMSPMGRGVDPLLARVQRRRSGSTRVIQAVQKIAQDWVLSPMLEKPRRFDRPPWPLLLLQHIPSLRRLPGRAIALGIRSERIAHSLAA
jgi:hypothetical protein